MASFQSLHNQAGLVSLDAARCDSSIVYRALDMMYPEPTPRATSIPLRTPRGVESNCAIPLIPLAAAQAKEDIKYRREGFEMKEARRHILSIRAERCRSLEARGSGSYTVAGFPWAKTSTPAFVFSLVSTTVNANAGWELALISQPRTLHALKTEDPGLLVRSLQQVGWTWVGPPMVPFSIGLAREPSKRQVSTGASRGRAAIRLSWCRPLRGPRDKYLRRK
ncbi:hypothetical protein BDY19DRAFT_902446 [Irpex rosettiformis]|uniref:Uncharacterized protein n=1 Tax=Irpex rosettiformis TaxID=378272 RepID=A0ACB8UHE6_9APHY|nr:hypothetical protein BDY19DRAFT_902446 [Irpex rosettiformis]